MSETKSCAYGGHHWTATGREWDFANNNPYSQRRELVVCKFCGRTTHSVWGKFGRFVIEEDPW